MQGILSLANQRSLGGTISRKGLLLPLSLRTQTRGVNTLAVYFRSWVFFSNQYLKVYGIMEQPYYRRRRVTLALTVNAGIKRVDGSDEKCLETKTMLNRSPYGKRNDTKITMKLYSLKEYILRVSI